MLMAADAGEGLSRLNVGNGPHCLDCQAPFVECLEKDRHSGWNMKKGGAVLFYGDGADDKLAGVFIRNTKYGCVHVRLNFWRNTDNAKSFYRSSFDTL